MHTHTRTHTHTHTHTHTNGHIERTQKCIDIRIHELRGMDMNDKTCVRNIIIIIMIITQIVMVRTVDGKNDLLYLSLLALI